MARAPDYEPILDGVGIVDLTDPVAAKIGIAQRVDRWAHAIFTGWGGSGIWIPVHMDQSETPDDVEFPVRIPPGVEYYHLRLLVSQSIKTAATQCVVNVYSSTSGLDTNLTWLEDGGGDSLEGAFEVSTGGLRGDTDGPLQVRSGVAWTFDIDTWRLTFDTGSGHIWGICATPIHEPR